MNEQFISICDLNYETESNKKRLMRNFPSSNLAPNYNVYPIPTRYSNMNVVDNRNKSNVSLLKTEPFNPKTVFYPGTRKAPWLYFAQNVDKESDLRNQFFALQNDDRRYYLPEVNSDMYENVVPKEKNPKFNPHDFLQKQETFSDINPDRCNLAPDLFYNNTRINLKK